MNTISGAPRWPALTLLTFAVALFGAAALLFNIQPMIGKMLLPRVGGAPAVWNVAMAFFQLALLLGYLLAHGLGRLSARVHGAVYLAILAAAFYTLPIALPADWTPSPGGFPPAAIVWVLLQTVALPFVALAITAPTLQRLFAASGHKAGHDPYFLYAASNLGSFVGLMAYPLLIEPSLDIPAQTALWKQGYLALGVLALLCLFNVKGEVKQEAVATAPTAPLTWRMRGWWVLLAAVPSSLTLGTTTHITTDVAAMPLIWALVLGLYLLTFVLAFNPPRWLKIGVLYEIHPWLVMLALAAKLPSALVNSSSLVVNSLLDMAPHLLAFFAAALLCHMRLAQSRPPASQLTSFYLWMSVGGAVGGALTAFLFPVIFVRPSEYALVLLLTLALNPRRDMGQSARHIQGLLILLLAMAVASLGFISGHAQYYWPMMGALGLVFLAVLLIYRHIMLLGAAVIGLSLLFLGAGDLRFIGRNFFGVARVYDDASKLEPGRIIRNLQHGTTRHGLQIIAPEVSLVPNAYYAHSGPLGGILDDVRFRNVAVIGLGAGNMNCYASPGRRFHFIEIDALIVQIAREQFTFLKDCGEPRLTVADARLALAASTETYDMIVLDAFSSDFIPAHLLTTEALQLYLSRLNRGGVIMLHISNRYFDLRGMLAESAAALGLWSLSNTLTPLEGDAEVNSPSAWFAIAREKIDLAPYVGVLEWGWAPRAPHIRPWTDNYSNLLDVLKQAE